MADITTASRSPASGRRSEERIGRGRELDRCVALVGPNAGGVTSDVSRSWSDSFSRGLSTRPPDPANDARAFAR